MLGDRTVIDEVRAERIRQVYELGYWPESDDRLAHNQLLRLVRRRLERIILGGGSRHELVECAALICAELDRRDRLVHGTVAEIERQSEELAGKSRQS